MPTLAAWVHDISPFVLRISDDFGVRWYGVSYALAFLLAWLVLRWLARRGATAIPQERTGDVILYCVAGVLIGGRLGYVLVYQPSLLWSFERSIPWWGVLAINKGGMASHGGMLGVIIASWFAARMLGTPDSAKPSEPRRRLPMLHVLDTLVLVTPMGLFLGRVANFINGELLGRVAAPPGAPAPWWSIKFPQELPDEWLRIHGSLQDRPPVQTDQDWEQIRALLNSIAPGEGFEAGYRRLLDQIQHGHHTLAERLAPLLAARHPSQLYQAFGEGILVGIVVWAVAAHPRRPGVVGCWFFISYGVIRIITEAFWRLPDAMNNARVLGVTRGQWLSAAMVAVGVVALPILRRIGRPPMGGWLKPAA